MNEIIQWVACFAIGLGAVSFLAFKYLVRKQIPGAACGKCKACSTASKLDQLSAGDGGDSHQRPPAINA